MQVLAVFTSLWIKDGYILRAYQYRFQGNGNSLGWALPVDAEFPEPDNSPRAEGLFLEAAHAASRLG